MRKHDFFTGKRLFRLTDIIGDQQKGIEPIIPVCRSTLYNWVKKGKFPEPVKIGRVSVWRSEDIERFIQEGGV